MAARKRTASAKAKEAEETAKENTRKRQQKKKTAENGGGTKRQRKAGSGGKATVPKKNMTHMEVLGITIEQLNECDGKQQEFALVRKVWLARALETHPDRGGDPIEFRRTRDAFNALKQAFERAGVTTLAGVTTTSAPTSSRVATAQEAASTADRPFPSHMYYAAAAEDSVPGYKVERAPSNRSSCNNPKCPSKQILKGDVRVSSLEKDSGKYTRSRHLGCWRVPVGIWAGLPKETCVDVASVIAALEDMDNISMTGFSVLDDVAKNDVASHCLDEQNHAKVTKTTEAVKDAGGKAAMVKAEQAQKKKQVQKKKVAADATAVAKSTSTTAVAVVDSKEKNMLILPKPGEGGIVAAQLASKTFVLTGVFPYLPGGAGLSQGKDYAKQFIHSHGGRCDGSVSGKTDYVVVGNAPGHSKVSKAAASGGRTKLVYFNTLVEGIMASDLEGRIAASPVDPAALSYSAGFRGNGLAYRLPPPKIVHELPSTA